MIPKSEISTLINQCFKHIDYIFELGKDESGQCNALAYSSRLKSRTDYVIGLMHSLGMQTKYDSIGNCYGLFKGQSSKKILITSHLDTVFNAGKFDGVLGIMLGLTYIKYLYKNNIFPHYSIEILICMGEESPGVTATFGSKAITGHYLQQELNEMSLAYAPSISVREAISKFLDDDKIPNLSENQLKKEDYHRAIEIHTEQYYLLKELSKERDNKPQIGVMNGVGGHIRAWLPVDEIQSDSTTFKTCILFKGTSTHTGATPMGKTHRDDALVKLSKEVGYILPYLKESSKIGISIGPNASTSIPDKVKLYFENVIPEIDNEHIQVISETNENPNHLLTYEGFKALIEITTSAEEAALKYPEARATVTQLKASNEKTQAFLDIRGATKDEMDYIFNKVISSQNKENYNVNVISKKSPSAFDPATVQETEDLLESALDGNIMKGKMSIPGQDIGVFNSFGIPSVLLFVESNTGHHPNEKVRKPAAEQALIAIDALINNWNIQH